MQSKTIHFKKSNFIFPAIVALCNPASALADSTTLASSQTMGSLVVTASRTPQKLVDALPSTTIISRTDIENSQAQDVLSLLRRQVGIEFAQTGGLGAQASVFMRGANSSQVLVMIDGQRINSVGSGAPLLSQLMVDEIDHVEIVRGNVSSLYGSEAIGGVIQIFTRRAEAGPVGEVSLQYGSEQNRALSAHVGTTFGEEGSKTRLNLTASTRSFDGFSAIDPKRASGANPDNDGYHNHSISFQASQQIGQQEVGVRGLQSEGKLDFDSSFDGPTATHRENSRFTTASVYANLQLTPVWDSQFQYGETKDHSHSTSSYPFSFVTGTTDNKSAQFSWHNSYHLAPTQTLTAGYENLDQRGSSTAYSAEFKRTVDSLMAGYVGDYSAQQVQINFRHDDYSDFGDVDSGLVAYGYNFGAGWKAIGQVSTAFRAPSFNDLYYPFFGNPKLKPEHSRSAELGLQYAKGHDFFRASLFRTRTRDLIVYDSTIFAANNIARARSTGLELSGSTVWEDWELSANLTMPRPIDEQTQQPLLRRAHRNFNLAVARNFGSWRVSADVQDAGARYDSDINTFARIQLKSYSVTNLGLRYTFNPNMSAGLALTNAFDKNYNLVDGYNTQGRALNCTLVVKF